MRFWHIQMYLPHGRGNTQIDSIKMLQEHQPVIGTGDWEDIQCYYFKNDNGSGLLQYDIVLVREGSKPIALCKVLDKEAYQDKTLTEKYLNEWYRNVEVLQFINSTESFPQPQGTLQHLKIYKQIHTSLLKPYMII
ncbi:MAG: hypothetical protein IPP48_10170 [Chitinophagaceae bacterium]|nr:hypothetical protein [Chitinophagaceae bacterium]